MQSFPANRQGGRTLGHVVRPKMQRQKGNPQTGLRHVCALERTDMSFERSASHVRGQAKWSENFKQCQPCQQLMADDPSQNAIEVADRCKAETRGAGYLTPATGQGAGSPPCHCMIMVSNMVHIFGLSDRRLLCWTAGMNWGGTVRCQWFDSLYLRYVQQRFLHLQHPTNNGTLGCKKHPCTGVLPPRPATTWPSVQPSRTWHLALLK